LGSLSLNGAMHFRSALPPSNLIVESKFIFKILRKEGLSFGLGYKLTTSLFSVNQTSNFVLYVAYGLENKEFSRTYF
jgi:hypothetical protein